MADDHAEWTRFRASFDAGVGDGLSIGVIALAEDRASVWDLGRFLSDLPGVGIFSTRLAMAAEVTPETLAAMRHHLRDAASTLLPSSRLDAVAFSCTSGTVAIGVAEVHAAIASGRPGVPISTPIEAGVQALRAFNASRIALLTPYRPPTAALVDRFFQEQGIGVRARTTFDLSGDLDMNRVSARSLLEAGQSCVEDAGDVDALFVSCTGLRTSPVVEALEQRLQIPVISSNQALAWHCLRLSGNVSPLDGHGSLFRLSAAHGPSTGSGSAR